MPGLARWLAKNGLEFGTMQSPETSFVVDKDTLNAIEALKETFGAKDSAEVLRKALALARLAAANSDNQHTLTIVSPKDGPKRIKLAG